MNFALLCGSDYTEGIQGVGPVKAMELMAEFPGQGLTSLLDFRKWWDEMGDAPHFIPGMPKIRGQLRRLRIPDGFPSAHVAKAYLEPEVDAPDQEFHWDSPDLDALRSFAEQKLGWDRERINQALKSVTKQQEQTKQKKIDSFFTFSPKETKAEQSSQSKRIQQVLRKMEFSAKGNCDTSQKARRGRGKGKIPVSSRRRRKNFNSGGGFCVVDEVKLSDSSSECD